MKHRTGTCCSQDGLPLFYQHWQPEQPSKAILAIIHGLGGHSGQFQNAVDALVPQGYAVYGIDLRGHGRSAGQQGYINAWQEFRDDVAAFVAEMRSQLPNDPCFLWGHSLGGTVVLDYGLRSPDQVQGLILTAPALSQVNLSPIKLAIGQVLSQIWPRFSLKVGIRHDLCAQDAQICAAYVSDPYRHEYGSARLATEFFATVKWINTHVDTLRIPLLVMHGGADQITLPMGSRDFFERVRFEDKQYVEYPNNYHDLHVDLDYPHVLADIQRWMEQHIPVRRPVTTERNDDYYL
jgi:alpha-beta hydrolase superfamily lysophospholipase